MPPRVLTVSEIFWPEGGGAELATRLILEQLSRAGYEITVVTGTRNPEPVPGVEFRYTPLLKASNRIVRWGLMEVLAQQRWFKELLKSHDVLYVPLAAYPLIPHAKKHGLRVVVHLHNYVPIRYHGVKYYFEPDALTLRQELKLALYHELHVYRNPARAALMPLSFTLYKKVRVWLRHANKIICVSKRQAEIVAKQAPELNGKIEVIYNPIPPELTNMKLEKRLDETLTILYVGGDSYVKGFYILLQALRELGKWKIKVKFIFANKYGSQSLEVLKQIGKRYKNLEIQVVGKVKYEELLKLHKKAWALVFPSIWEEPLPYVIVEAALSGTIPISARVGGIMELLDGTVASAYMFTPGNVDELVRKIKKLSTLDHSEIITFGHKLRVKILEEFNPNKLNREILKILMDVVERCPEDYII